MPDLVECMRQQLDKYHADQCHKIKEFLKEKYPEVYYDVLDYLDRGIVDYSDRLKTRKPE